VRTALGGRDDVDEALHLGVVARAPAQGDVDLAVALHLSGDQVPRLLVHHGHRLGERTGVGHPPGIGERSVDRQEIDELRDAALVGEAVHGRIAGFVERLRPAVGDLDREPRNEERGLPRAGDEGLRFEPRRGQEDLRIGPVPHPRAREALLHLADHTQLRRLLEGGERAVGPLAGEDAGLAVPERHRPGLPVAVHLDVEARREGVDHRGAHPVQAAGGGVSAAAELAARVQLGEHELHARETALRLHIDRDAAAVVRHGHAAVVVQGDPDLVAVSGEGLVDRVVDDLPEAVHEAARVGRADVHARPLAHCFEPLENGEMSRGIARIWHCWDLLC
jgi:hypothetical protein